jgi:hypothetical protein
MVQYDLSTLITNTADPFHGIVLNPANDSPKHNDESFHKLILDR